ncbi:MAG: tetraacyldisaccharide 4'-kinase [Sphingobacteriales bacterium]|nr:tetraacyldisaccharide 4'-kinase [Sphingobacteriales bacterium]
MQFPRILLYPFSIIYGIITFVRNKFYDWGIFKSTSFSIPIISVGNLEVGGSGKTPMVEYLIRLLNDDFKLATLSRGYGRKTKGFLWVKPDDLASNTGDEPLQIKLKFQDISVAVCENRVFGINKIQQQHDLILMDDAFQHRAVKPSLSLLLFDYHQIQKPKILLPAGNYREAFSGRKRADIIVITKCPNQLSVSEMSVLDKQMRLHPHQKLFFSGISYAKELSAVFKDDKLSLAAINPNTQVLLLTGIAKTAPLVQELKKHSKHIIHHAYADHHLFSQKNMLKLVSDFEALPGDDKIILTTEKDAVRLNAGNFKSMIQNLPIYAWPIEINFLANRKTEFDNIIKKYARSNQRIR